MKTLTATARDLSTSLTHLRSEGLTPAVIYKKGMESLPLCVKENEVRSLYKHVRNEEAFTLNLEKESYTVTLKDIQVHVVTGTILHIDFLVA